MALTPAQLATLKADIEADPAFNSVPLTPDGSYEIAQVYNQDTADFWVWKPTVPFSDIYSQVSPDATTWNWAFYSGMNAGEQGAWTEMGGPERSLQMNLPQVRAGLDEIFIGPQGGQAANDHIRAMSRELATRAEKLFATGTGTSAAPATRVFSGDLSYEDVHAARTLP